MGILIGHLLGDYIFQNDWMAKSKKSPGMKGLFRCLVHCLVWTICVMLCTGWFHHPKTLLIFSLVLISHIIPDRTYIVVKWMEWFGSFGYPPPSRPIDYMPSSGDFSCSEVYLKGVPLSSYLFRTRVLEYAIVDNTFHLVMLYLIQLFVAK